MKYFNYLKTRNHIYMAMILSFAVWMPAAVILACPAAAYASATDSGVSVQPLMIGETDSVFLRIQEKKRWILMKIV